MIKRKEYYQGPHPIETTKVAEIRDVFGNLRYKVILTNYNNIIKEEELYHKSYEIEVVNYFSGEDPFVIIHRPNVGESKIYDYIEALSIYENYKKHYNNLICAETRDIQDINIYKEKVDYKRVEVKCCAHCAYCKISKNPNDHIIGQTGKAVCTNPNLIKINYLDFCDTHLVDACGFHKGRHDMNHHHLDLCPRVDLDGVCKDYKRSIKHIHEVDGMSLVDIVYGKLNSKFDKFMEGLSGIISEEAVSELSGQINDIISSSIDINKEELIRDVGYEIDKKLSEGIIIDGDDSTEEYGD